MELCHVGLAASRAERRAFGQPIAAMQAWRHRMAGAATSEVMREIIARRRMPAGSS
jgi:hypothetical protein